MLPGPVQTLVTELQAVVAKLPQQYQVYFQEYIANFEPLLKSAIDSEVDLGAAKVPFVGGILGGIVKNYMNSALDQIAAELEQAKAQVQAMPEAKALTPAVGVAKAAT